MQWTFTINNARAGLGAFSVELWNADGMQGRVFYRDPYGTTSPLGSTTSLYGNPIATEDSTRNYDLTAPADLLPINPPLTDINYTGDQCYVLTDNITADTYLLFVSQLTVVDGSGFPILDGNGPQFSSLSGSATATNVTVNAGIVSGVVTISSTQTPDVTTFPTPDLTSLTDSDIQGAGHYMIEPNGLIAYVGIPFPIHTYGAEASVAFDLTPVLTLPN